MPPAHRRQLRPTGAERPGLTKQKQDRRHLARRRIAARERQLTAGGGRPPPTGRAPPPPPAPPPAASPRRAAATRTTATCAPTTGRLVVLARGELVLPPVGRPLQRRHERRRAAPEGLHQQRHHRHARPDRSVVVAQLLPHVARGRRPCGGRTARPPPARAPPTPAPPRAPTPPCSRLAVQGSGLRGTTTLESSRV